MPTDPNLERIVKIQGPLYNKDSWTKIKGIWPPDD